jgi:hypothetical protein
MPSPQLGHNLQELEREKAKYGELEMPKLTCLSEFLGRLWLGRLQGELFFSLHMGGIHTIQPIFFSHGKDLPNNLRK